MQTTYHHLILGRLGFALAGVVSGFESKASIRFVCLLTVNETETQTDANHVSLVLPERHHSRHA